MTREREKHTMGQFTFTETEIEGGVFIIEPRVFGGDERGYFMETYNKADFQEAGIDCEFVQDNQSKSSKGVLRGGLHFQKQYPQAKLVRVTKGEVYDVAVDLRKGGSPTYGKYVGGAVLTAEKKNQFFIPPRGFAHGSWSFPMRQSLSTSVMSSTTQRMRVASGGMIRVLGLSGRMWEKNIA